MEELGEIDIKALNDLLNTDLTATPDLSKEKRKYKRKLTDNKDVVVESSKKVNKCKASCSTTENVAATINEVASGVFSANSAEPPVEKKRKPNKPKSTEIALLPINNVIRKDGTVYKVLSFMKKYELGPDGQGRLKPLWNAHFQTDNIESVKSYIDKYLLNTLIGDPSYHLTFDITSKF